jgi:hypothetical protein
MPIRRPVKPASGWWPQRGSKWHDWIVSTGGFTSPAVVALRVARDCLAEAARAQIVLAPAIAEFIQRIDALRRSHDRQECAQLSSDIRAVAESLRDDNAGAAQKQVVHSLDAAADLCSDAS